MFHLDELNAFRYDSMKWRSARFYLKWMFYQQKFFWHSKRKQNNLKKIFLLAIDIIFNNFLFILTSLAVMIHFLPFGMLTTKNLGKKAKVQNICTRKFTILPKIPQSFSTCEEIIFQAWNRIQLLHWQVTDRKFNYDFQWDEEWSFEMVFFVSSFSF